MSQTARPNPERIFRALNSYQLTAILKAAIELGIFTAIGEGANTPAKIAEKCRAAERGARILCDYLVVHGFLAKEGKHYGLTSDAAVFLDRRSPAYIGTCANFVASEFGQEQFRHFADAVRRGGSAIGMEGPSEANQPMWVEFARSMAPLQAQMAEMVVQAAEAEAMAARKVLDVAAGHGMFGITLAKRNPGAEIYALDWPPVLEVARENAHRAGVASRYHTIEGDAFQVDMGSGYDLVLLTNFLHHFASNEIEGFLGKVRAAVKPAGLVLTLDFLPNDDRVSPPVPASFAVIMLAATRAGDAYTFREYEGMFRNAGFAKNELRILPTTHSVILSRQ